MKKLIYLDWNVMKCLYYPRTSAKSDRLQILLAEKMERLKRRNHIYIPYCNKHLEELFQSHQNDNEQNLYADLEVLNDITSQTMMMEESGICYIKMKNAHDAYQSRKEQIVKQHGFIYQFFIENYEELGGTSYNQWLGFIESKVARQTTVEQYLPYVRYADYFVTEDSAKLETFETLYRNRSVKTIICNMERFLYMDI